jgi:predicted transcriptional regulator
MSLYYKSPLVDNTMGTGRSISIILPNEIWSALDQIARDKNRSKATLLRPLVEQFIEENKFQRRKTSSGKKKS